MDQKYRITLECVRVLIIILCIASLATPARTADADEFSLPRWISDIERFDEMVLRELGHRFARDRRACERGRVAHYFDVYQELLDSLRGQVHPVTLMILRESLLATGQELGPIGNVLPCAKIDRWQVLETAIRSKLALIANVITLLELCGAMGCEKNR